MDYSKKFFLSIIYLAAGQILAVSAGEITGPVNLIRNGSFEQVEEGKIAGWKTQGDETVRQVLSPAEGMVSGRSARLECRLFQRQTRLGYAMLVQAGKMELQKGQWYRFSCWARQEGMKPGMITTELQTAAQQGNYWKTTLLFYQMALGGEWQYYEKYFQAGFVGEGEAELLFYFDSTGTLWLDEVEVAAAAEPYLEYTNRIERIHSRNLLPNAGFECGTEGWSSLGERPGWIGGLSGLYGEIQKGQAWEGEHCLRIELGPGKTPATSFDFFQVNYNLQHAPLLANVGWMEVRPGSTYVLSAYMRADTEGVPVKMQIRFADPLQGTDDGSSYITRDRVEVGAEEAVLTTVWQRYSIRVAASRRYAFVAVGPDMRAKPESNATVWIDGVQLEEAEEAGEFQTRQPVEIGCSTGKFGNVFAAGEPTGVTLYGYNRTSAGAGVEVGLRAADYFDETVYRGVQRLELPAGGQGEVVWPLPLGKGYYNLFVSWESGGRKKEYRVPVAVIEPYSQRDSVFGVNHAPGTDTNCVQLCKAGVVWAREWALTWQHIEPEPGQFQFEMADRHINRVLGTGMQMVQQLPPFPSAEWNTTAPAELTERFAGFANLYGRMAYPPSDPQVFRRYIQEVVEHYRSQIRIWEYLNEPFYTTHSFPNVEQLDCATEGFPGARFEVQDYISWLKVMYEAVKQADPEAKVIGGISGRPDLLTREFFQAGGLDYVDYFNLHIYPGLRRPEGYIQPMAEMVAEMEKSPSGRRPIWMTEYAYFSTDELPWQPYVVSPDPWAANRLLRDEKQGGDYLVRYAVIMLAHGVEKIFYHNGAGVSSEVNSEIANLESWMLGYAGVPRKVYVAQAVLADMLGAAPRFAGEWKKPPVVNGQRTDEVYGYAFQCGDRAVLAAWAARADGDSVRWGVEIPAAVRGCNIAGATLERNSMELGESPVYLLSEEMAAEDLVAKVKLRLIP